MLEALNWASLCELEGDELETQYATSSPTWLRSRGILGIIFKNAQNKIQNPACLKHLLVLIDRKNWSGTGFDVKGRIYKGLLQRNAEDVKGIAGQYFTPRPLTQAVDRSCY